MVHFRTPKVSLPPRCAARGGPGGAWSTPELRCTIHSTVLSCHCLPPSRCPPPPSPLCPAQSEGQTWARINTVRWLPFTFLSALGAWHSTCGRMWCGQSPLEAAVPRPWPTLHHPCLLLGSGQHSPGTEGPGPPVRSPHSSQPHDQSLLLFRIWGSEAAALVGPAFPSVSIGMW